jgi:hypothetical protein
VVAKFEFRSSASMLDGLCLRILGRDARLRSMSSLEVAPSADWPRMQLKDDELLATFHEPFHAGKTPI